MAANLKQITTFSGCRTIIRYRKEETASGWLNAPDDAGIPSAVIEALYVNNRTHALPMLAAKKWHRP